MKSARSRILALVLVLAMIFGTGCGTGASSGVASQSTASGSASEANSESAPAEEGSRDVAVSYTHLDVYKRQTRVYRKLLPILRHQ